jgi:hypothetical protein
MALTPMPKYEHQPVHFLKQNSNKSLLLQTYTRKEPTMPYKKEGPGRDKNDLTIFNIKTCTSAIHIAARTALLLHCVFCLAND